MVCPRVAVLELSMMYAGTVVTTPLMVVEMEVNIGGGGARTVGLPSMVTVWPIVAVMEGPVGPGMINAGMVVVLPSITVGTCVKIGVGVGREGFRVVVGLGGTQEGASGPESGGLVCDGTRPEVGEPSIGGLEGSPKPLLAVLSRWAGLPV